MSEKVTAQEGIPVLGLAALGIVFGDIGTSPLYTFKTVLALTGGKPDVLGSVSLILWTLIIITTVKYVNFAMRVDNDGEGGILALMSLLGLKKQNRPVIVGAGLFGAALIYGDGAITPAISVLSALEGVEQVMPSLTPWVICGAVAILVALFALQPLGTTRIGKSFGSVMLIWFCVMAAMGIYGILQYPGVLVAINPCYGLKYLASGGLAGFLVLGGVFLCVTGAEALYADMGHFGPAPIRLAWNFVVFPSLILNYIGQAAIVLNGSPTEGSIFYRLCPPVLLAPLIVLATVATIIASQSIITGAFSMTRQAIQLGWMPRFNIRQTSAEGFGQIYVGAVNWLLMITTVALTIGFGKSDNLAAAYGIAVSMTMLMTSVLLFIAMREIWQWTIVTASAVAGLFLIVDSAFFAANMTKFFQGGYVPLAMAIAVYAIMWIWHRGTKAMHNSVQKTLIPTDRFLTELQSGTVARVPGTAVFLTLSDKGVPPVMVWHVGLNRALQERVFVLRWSILPVPRVAEADRFTIAQKIPNFWIVEARYGFMEMPDVPKLLASCMTADRAIDLTDVTYYVGRTSIVPREDGQGLPSWQREPFAAMSRNSAQMSDYLKVPNDRLVEIGRQIPV
ncbi:potassium transporter Kup [Mesorhizobium escarrei]|uniref:Probable potassium transport system protein Kup n=1 Tax=Mesorhizobium escarrei TaxID=666018 RepID=A0ABM9EA19_9HYPH|nr:KUP/HAK/KT family potassium transporter [Mesorhizobium escarrei]CAH2406105.1 putative potassium transport system protein kup 1 [Mesorhizobium escarrei]